MLCYFLLYSKVNQLDIHIYILFIFFPSMIYHRLLNIPLCTTQLDLLFTHFIHKSLPQDKVYIGLSLSAAAV